MMLKRSKKIYFFILIVFFVSFQSIIHINAQTEEDLRLKIAEKSDAIEDLEKEIALYQTEINKIGSEAKSLQNTIKTLDLNNKKLKADLKVTETKISQTSLQIQRLEVDIDKTSINIDANKEAIEEVMRYIYELDSQNFINKVLLYENLSDYSRDVEMSKAVQNNIRNKVTNLGLIKKDYENKKIEAIEMKDKLTKLKNSLTDQTKIIEINRKEKDKLLSLTKNKEAGYKILLDQKLALKEAFEKELLEFESALDLQLNLDLVPDENHDMLRWPVDNPYITQYFGKTDFSETHSHVYNGQGHNGIDFRAPIGTPIRSAAKGVVRGFGNTDTVCPGASYGMWVLVDHENGLSTLYAHLSITKVSIGDQVMAGDLIGYSGNTGYSTGPHLHFTVYLSNGVKILDRKSRVCGGTYRMPIADLKAYLNPLTYLPKI